MGSGGNCFLTGKYYPSLDEHHVIPREYGGENGPTLFLGPDIHQTLHRSVNNPTLKDKFISSLPSQSQDVAIKLILMIKESKETYNKSKEVVSVNLKIPYSLHQVLLTEATSRQLTVANFILKLLGA